MLFRRTCFEKEAFLYVLIFSADLSPRSSCSEKLTTLNNYLITKGCWFVEVSLRISSYFEKITVEKK